MARDGFYLYVGTTTTRFGTEQEREDDVKRMVLSGEYIVDAPEGPLVCIDLAFDEKGEPELAVWEYSNGYLGEFLSDDAGEG